MEECVLVWMSAGNSYFKEENIIKILEFASKNFKKVIVMAPDEPAEYTFRALGISENKIKRKAKLNANLLQNRAKRIIEILIKRGVKTDFKIVEWNEEIFPNKDYQDMLKFVNNLYLNNKKFREDARETTKKVIENKIKNKDMEKAIDEAVNYLLKELSFILACPKIYRVKNITYIYHKKWEIYENLINGLYDNKPRLELKFLLFNKEGENINA